MGVGDLDDDGDIDPAVAQSTPKIAIYPNRGDGTFGNWRLVPVAEFPGMTIARDLNLDGRPDLVTTHNGV